MTGSHSEGEFDVVVIGSGMGGMTTAAALSRFKHKVLLLEQAPTIGGLTHSFSRGDFTWDVGLHYCGTFGPGQQSRRILDWLSGSSIDFHPIGTVYDTLHFPHNVDIQVARPAAAYMMELKERFPGHEQEIDAYFEAIYAAEETVHMIAAERSMPEPLMAAHRWWNRKKIDHWCGRTTREVIDEIISDPKLAAVLSAQWGTYGGVPKEASFAVHAKVVAHYLEGAAYPVGGAASIAQGLVPVIKAAGGEVRASTPVESILIRDGSAIGVRTTTGEEIHAPVIVSAAGARETVQRMLPEEIRQSDWALELGSFHPAICHFEMYLGFEGEIARYGATPSNHWFYETWETHGSLWCDVNDPILAMFISFPSLKDAAHDPGPLHEHTGDLLVLADWQTVAEFADGGAEARPADWAAFKQKVESKLMTFFAQKFPALMPLLTYKELGTPLATAQFTRHDKGGFYGVETTPRRMLSDAFRASTPVPNLYLTGQDVMIPGIAGALAGGMLGAAAIDPRVYSKLTYND